MRTERHERAFDEEMNEGRVAAFFDLDGTLVPEPSVEKRFWRALRSEGSIPKRNYLRWIWETARRISHGPRAATQGNKHYLRNVAASEQDENFGRVLPDFFEEAVEHVLWHARKGHHIVIVSGTLAPLAVRAARRLQNELWKNGADVAVHICATRLEEIDGKWSGKILGAPMFGQAKAMAVRRLANEWRLDLSRCSAYGDSVQDRWMLAAVGQPVAVNPSRGLRRAAKLHGWTVLRWSRVTQPQSKNEREYLERTRKVAPLASGDPA